MTYGYFDDENREYVITNPKTPTKWINYIGGLSFGGYVDQVGGALICKGDPAENRIVKYITQLPPSSFNGETLYVRIQEADGTYKVFSPFYVPTLDNYESYECRVGLGFSKFTSVFYGIQTTVTVFVPKDGNREIRDIQITNLRDTNVKIDVIPVVEYTHFDSLKQLTNADWVPQTMQSELVEKEGHTIVMQYAFMKKNREMNYFTANRTVESFETERDVFLGEYGYGTWQAPEALQKASLSNSVAVRGDNIAALLIPFGEIGAGKSERVITQLGQCKSIEEEYVAIQNFYKEEVVESAFEELATFWNQHLDHLQVKTPSLSFDRMINVHNPRQCYVTKNWSRYLSLYQLGYGARGIGFRDTAQDVLGIMGQKPEEGRELIELLLSIQNLNGSAMHQVNPKTKIASIGDAAEMEDRPDFYGDDHLWIVLSTAAYIKESGNIDFLQKSVPFYPKDKEGNPVESASVLEHLSRALHFTKTNVGKHGIPLLGFADWNDTVNLPTGSESLFNACLYGKALKEMIDLMEFLGESETMSQFTADYEAMKEVVNEAAWDGEWYVRYFDQEGNPLGSKSCENGKIYVNSQSWSVISGFSTEERGKKSLEAVEKYLATEKGIKLSYPSFNGFDPKLGGITTYPAGAKENGGIFLHTNPWVMIAEALMGNGDKAFDYYSRINPANKNEIPKEYEIEPYVYAQNILGNEHSKFGLGRNSWLSGTSSWTYQAATQYILGIRPHYKGLIVDPCIPSEWNEFEVTRHFRGASYHILVKNPLGLQKGKPVIELDGVAFEGEYLPIFGDGCTHEVVITLQ